MEAQRYLAAQDLAPMLVFSIYLNLCNSELSVLKD